MKKIKELIEKNIIKHGSVIAAFAFVFVTIASNTPCFMPYYEPTEPQGLDKYKKFSK